MKYVKRSLFWLATVLTATLTYIGSLAVISCIMNGDERSLFIAIFPTVLLMFVMLEQKKEERNDENE